MFVMLEVDVHGNICASRCTLYMYMLNLLASFFLPSHLSLKHVHYFCTHVCLQKWDERACSAHDKGIQGFF